MARILGISGSLRRDSHNTSLLRAAAETAGQDVELELYDGLKEIPPYDEDDEVHPPAASVARLNAAIANADAVLFATPEYNTSIPGHLKNAIDWISRPVATNVLRNKPVLVVGASTGAFGAAWAQAELRKVLAALGARVVDVELPVPACPHPLRGRRADRRGDPGRPCRRRGGTGRGNSTTRTREGRRLMRIDASGEGLIAMSKGRAKRIRVGIIGANPDRGWAAQAHIPALKSLSDDFEITALSTSRRESADAASKLFGVPVAFDNHQDLVNSPGRGRRRRHRESAVSPRTGDCSARGGQGRVLRMAARQRPERGGDLGRTGEETGRPRRGGTAGPLCAVGGLRA